MSSAVAALDVPASLWSQLGRLVELQTAAAATSASSASASAAASDGGEAARRADRMRAIDCLIRYT